MPTTVRDAIKIVTQDGWFFVRQTGSHRQFHHPIKPGTVTIPGKPSDELRPKTFNTILSQAGLRE